MESPLDVLVVTDENREAIELIKNITQEHDKPQLIALIGPTESGKTLLLRARAAERDLLSTKHVQYRLCAEPARAMRAGVADKFFEQLGSKEVLLLDDIEGLFEDIQISSKLMPLLMQ